EVDTGNVHLVMLQDRGRACAVRTALAVTGCRLDLVIEAGCRYPAVEMWVEAGFELEIGSVLFERGKLGAHRFGTIPNEIGAVELECLLAPDHRRAIAQLQE